MITGSGQPPNWYLSLKAAGYLGVPVWTLHEEAPVLWRNRALAAMEAEGEARSQQKQWEETKREHERGG